MNFSFDTLWTILIALIAFGILIFVHELGHFSFAKKLGFKVNAFAIGFGPKLFKFTKGETEYSLRVFPMGGFCAMEGEDEESNDERAFNNKPVWKRTLVILAGSVFNLILGFLLFTIIITSQGDFASTTIHSFFGNETSHKTGLQAGDKFLSINKNLILVDSDIGYSLLRDSDGIFDMVVLRDGKKVHLKNIKFDMSFNKEAKKSFITRDFYVTTEKATIKNVVPQAALKTVSFARIVWQSLGDLLAGRNKVSEMSGPVGTVQVIGQASRAGIIDLLFLMAFITVNLGVFNLLPIPGLDGGRLIFLIIEGVRRKPLLRKYEGYIHAAGVALLVCLILFVTYFDFSRLFNR